MILKFDAKIIILVDSLWLSVCCFLYLVLIISKMNNLERIYKMSFASVYPHYIAKAEKKNRTKEEVNTIIFWLTGYNEKDLENIITTKVNFEDFFNHAPQINLNATKITGVICGYRVEDIEDTIMRQIRYLDKLVDELAKGKKMEKILRE